jgi:quinol monooxygenase YgiN
MIIVIGSVTAHAATFDALRQASLDHVHRSRTEDGCLLHSVQADCENPLRLFFYEQWRDLPALHAHGGQAGSIAFLKAVRALAAASESITVYEASPVPL